MTRTQAPRPATGSSSRHLITLPPRPFQFPSFLPPFPTDPLNSTSTALVTLCAPGPSPLMARASRRHHRIYDPYSSWPWPRAFRRRSRTVRRTAPQPPPRPTSLLTRAVAAVRRPPGRQWVDGKVDAGLERIAPPPLRRRRRGTYRRFRPQPSRARAISTRSDIGDGYS